eukprot:Nitzschia sp. Nitz4//scaffold63_size106090//72850//74086//NITZ4_004401-RA/size106090-exonerate_est2genome-gene-0.7-mRNA-1//1//CDS//3329556008//746//frame0
MEGVDHGEEEPSALELLKRTEMALDEMLLDLQNDDKPAENGDLKKQDTEKSGGAPSQHDDPSGSDLEELDYLDHPDHASYHSDEHEDDTDHPAGAALSSENKHGEEELRAELEAFAISPWRNYLYGGPNAGPMPSAPSTPIRSSSFTQLSTLIRTDSVLGDEDQGGDPVAMDLSDMFGEKDEKDTTQSAPNAANPTTTVERSNGAGETHETSNGDVEGGSNMQSLYIDDEDMPADFKYINPKLLCTQLWCALLSLGALALIVYLLFQIDDSKAEDPLSRLGSPSHIPDIGCDQFMVLPESTLAPFTEKDSATTESPVDWTEAPSSKHSSRKQQRRKLRRAKQSLDAPLRNHPEQQQQQQQQQQQ